MDVINTVFFIDTLLDTLLEKFNQLGVIVFSLVSREFNGINKSESI